MRSLVLASALFLGCAPPMYIAAKQDNSEYIRRLSAEGADVEREYDGMTPLVAAAMAGNMASIKVLLDVGARIDARPGGAGMTALMWAAFYGRTEAVKYLLERGADPSLKDAGPEARGWTALQFARDQDRADAIAVLEAARRP